MEALSADAAYPLKVLYEQCSDLMAHIREMQGVDGDRALLREGVKHVYATCSNLLQDDEARAEEMQPIEALAAWQTLNAHVALLGQGTTSVTAGTTQPSWWSTLVAKVKSLASTVWAIVSSALAVSEWSIRGSIGHPVLGLVNAEVEIKFS